jgi:LmbE family N-acetylglucosaminyl deacetylase
MTCSLGMILSVFLMLVAPCAQAEGPQAIEPLLSEETRLMVFGPHPDDESLGAGGLIQRVLTLGGKVRVVFMTNGDGFPEGVEEEDHITHPTAKDFRDYGVERREEALRALATLGVKEHEAIFLGFPDGGLCYLLGKFRADPLAYTSPYTLENRPPAFAMIIPHTDYNGSDLTMEIARVLAVFRPNLVAVTPPEDQHPDHCATYSFVREALIELGKRGQALKPVVLSFLIHFGQWPVGQGAGTGFRLDSPDGFPAKGSKWISFPLRANEAETKRKAIFKHHTQMLVMGRYLLSFARANELFILEQHGQGVARAMEKISCCGK